MGNPLLDTPRASIAYGNTFVPVLEHCEIFESSQLGMALGQGASSVVWKRPFALSPALVNEILEQPRGVQAPWETHTDPWIIPALIDEEYELSPILAEPLYEDIVGLMLLFRQVSRAKVIGVRLEPVESDTCRLFHTDRVPLRMVCTYFGPGSEWVENGKVNRQGLGRGNNALVLGPGVEPRSVPTGSPFFMVGEGNSNVPAVVHRSPPIEAQGARRILLRMDVLSVG